MTVFAASAVVLVMRSAQLPIVGRFFEMAL